MLKRSGYILLLAALFFAAAKGLNAAGFWALAGLPEPHGYLTEGFIFLGLLFILQNGLFDPYLRVMEERAAQTTGKKAAAEKTRQGAEEMIQKYRTAIEEARIAAVRAREQQGLMAEEEERKRTGAAREKAKADLEAAVARMEKEAVEARKELLSSVDPLTAEIVGQVLGSNPKKGQLRLVGMP